MGASPAVAGGAPDIPPTFLSALCARSAKKSRRRQFSSDFLRPAEAAVPQGAVWWAGGGLVRLAQTRRFGVAHAPVAGRSLRASMPSALSTPLSLSPSYPALTGEAGSRSMGDPSLATLGVEGASFGRA